MQAYIVKCHGDQADLGVMPVGSWPSSENRTVSDHNAQHHPRFYATKIGDIMLIKKLCSCSLLAFLFSLSVAPAFSEDAPKTLEVALAASGVAPALSDVNVGAVPSKAEAVKVNIISPADGATIKAMARNKLKYEVIGDEGHHARLYINGKESVLLRERVGTKRVAKLPAGTHELCVKALDKSHNEIGIADCITVTAM